MLLQPYSLSLNLSLTTFNFWKTPANASLTHFHQAVSLFLVLTHYNAMYRKIYLPVIFILTMLTAAAQHPFKFDNTSPTKQFYLNEAFHLMDSMQNYLYSDVRSPGEYADTSRATALNIGRIRGSVKLSRSIPYRHDLGRTDKI